MVLVVFLFVLVQAAPPSAQPWGQPIEPWPPGQPVPVYEWPPPIQPVQPGARVQIQTQAEEKRNLTVDDIRKLQQQRRQEQQERLEEQERAREEARKNHDPVFEVLEERKRQMERQYLLQQQRSPQEKEQMRQQMRQQMEQQQRMLDMMKNQRPAPVGDFWLERRIGDRICLVNYHPNCPVERP